MSTDAWKLAAESAARFIEVKRAIEGWPGCLEPEDCTDEKYTELLAAHDEAELVYETNLAEAHVPTGAAISFEWPPGSGEAWTFDQTKIAGSVSPAEEDLK